MKVVDMNPEDGSAASTYITPKNNYPNI